MSRGEAAKIIEMAIDRGVPMFNHGNAEGTAALYMATSEKLMRFGGLNSEERARLQMGVTAASTAATTNASAWELRYALDDVNASLHNNGIMRASSRMSR